MATPFGKYLLESKLAEGGMAEIFLARQAGIEGFEREVVVKRLLPDLSIESDFVRMFLNEARLAARLNHPNIVQIFELGQEEGAYYLAMEYIRGEDLRGLAQQADAVGMRPSVGLICRIICDALAGLHYAHTRTGADGQPLGLVHRDISPQNVLVTYDGGVKIIDFGIAKATQRQSSEQTQAGLLKGKYAYMSPEQTRGGALDARSDVFSAGILLWELLTWKRLFKRGTDLATLVAVSDEPAPPPSQIDPEVPEDLDPIVLKALALDPNERYPSAKAFQNALEEYISEHNLEADTRALRQYMRELFKERLAQEAAAAAAEAAAPRQTAQRPLIQSRPRPAAPMTMPLQTIDPAARAQLLGQLAQQASRPLELSPPLQAPQPVPPGLAPAAQAPQAAPPQRTPQPFPTPPTSSGPQAAVPPQRTPQPFPTPPTSPGPHAQAVPPQRTPQPFPTPPTASGPHAQALAPRSGPQALALSPAQLAAAPQPEPTTPPRRILIAIAAGLIFGVLTVMLLQHVLGLP